MSYYILPKINTELIIDPCVNISMDKITPYISQNLVNYVIKATSNLNNLLSFDTTYTFKDLNQLTNPFEYLFSNIPNSNLSICKVKPAYKIYYDMLEIYNTLKLSECLPNRNMTSLYYGTSGSCVLEYMQSFRDNFSDTNILIEPVLHNQFITPLNNGMNMLDETEYTSIPENISSMCDYIYFELPDKTYLDTNNYILGLLQVVKYLLTYQSSQGTMILKLGHTYYKPIIDILYIISSLYNKVYIIKPNTNNNMSDERYLVCKTFTAITQKNQIYLDKFDKMYTIFYKERHEITLQSIIKNELSTYFLNKMEECNIIMGQQQLDAYDQMLNLIRNKNKLEKLEAIRKHNIQKCIHWCEKYKLPYNKFADKINIFLPIAAYENTNIKNNKVDYDSNEEESYNLENTSNGYSANSIICNSNNNIDNEDYFNYNHISNDLLDKINYGE